MTKQDLYNSLFDCLQFGDRHGALSALKTYRQCHCDRPTRISAFDSLLGTSRRIEVPCGKCYHCRETARNGWVTRAYYHLEDYKYCYFVTLTYRSFMTINNDKPSGYIVDYLRDALWHYDNKNQNGTYSWNPCILVKSHYQNFIKRLRKNTGNDGITYMLCGETGKKFGRPHFHMILFSKDRPLTRLDIARAWSIKLSRSSDGKWHRSRNDKEGLWFLLGRYQFDDLVSNGTITNEDILVDGNHFDANKCFSYVCKYLHKQQFNIDRYRIAFDSLYSKFSTGKWEFSADGTQKVLLVNQPDYHLRSEYESVPDFYTNNIILSYYNYAVKIHTFPKDFDLFCQSFRPFYECSRGTPIGSLYLRSHWEDIVKGQCPKSPLQNKGFVFPSYYKKRVYDSRYPFKRCNPSTKSFCFSKGNIPYFREIVSDMFKDPGSVRVGIDLLHVKESDFKSRFTLRDLDNTYYLVGFIDAHGERSFQVDKYRYSRSARSYCKIGSLTIQEFDNILAQFYLSALAAHLHDIQEQEKQLRFYNDIPMLFDTFIDRLSDVNDFDFIDAMNLVTKSIDDDIRRLYSDKDVNNPNSLE